MNLIANWKLNGSKSMIDLWLDLFFKTFTGGSDYDFIGVAPPYTLIDYFKSQSKGLSYGAQNIDYEELGARTGEISSNMIEELGGIFSIIGHSERRLAFNETSSDIQKKIISASNTGLIPVFCIGESDIDQKNQRTNQVLEKQIMESMPDNNNIIEQAIVAYEPIWAIGTGKTPTSSEINDTHASIRNIFKANYGCEPSSVLYGGSVSESNCKEIFSGPYVDGALIGGASLDGGSFGRIANEFIKSKG